MLLKKTPSLALTLMVLLSACAAAEDLSVTFKDGAKQTLALSQPAANISKIEFGTAGAAVMAVPAAASAAVPSAAPAASNTPAVSVAPMSTDSSGYVKGFEGKWNSKWGVLTFTVDSTKVTGNYTYSSGKIEAALGSDGKTMEGTWSEAPTYSAPQYSGRCVFTLASDGSRIDGHWWYGDGRDGGEWNGIRIK